MKRKRSLAQMIRTGDEDKDSSRIKDPKTGRWASAVSPRTAGKRSRMSPAAPRLGPGMVVLTDERSAEQPQPAEKKESVSQETRPQTLGKRDIRNVSPLATGVNSSGNEPADGVGVSAGASDGASDSDDDRPESDWIGLLHNVARLETTEAGISNISLRRGRFCVNCTHREDPSKDERVCKDCKEPWDFNFYRKRGVSEATHVGAVRAGVGAEIEYYDPSAGGDAPLRSRTAIGYDRRMLKHELKQEHAGRDMHPERPDRIRWITDTLEVEGLLRRCVFVPSRKATRDELKMVHTERLVNKIQSLNCRENIGRVSLPGDTYATEHTGLAARLAAGTCAAMAMDIMNGRYQNGFALVRPPGHHASSCKPQGFCFHNNAAVATRAAQKAGAKKVLILDWDVHHGNGTQEIFKHDPTGGIYPHSGSAAEVGDGPGAGFSVNIPWPHANVEDDDYIFAFQHVVMPISQEFGPDITIVSAGFDAAAGDPLGECEVSPTGFAQMTQLLSSLSGGKMLLILEGGYNLVSISDSAVAVVKVLLGDCPTPILDTLRPSADGKQAVGDAIRAQSAYWPKLEIPPGCESLPVKTGTD